MKNILVLIAFGFSALNCMDNGDTRSRIVTREQYLLEGNDSKQPDARIRNVSTSHYLQPQGSPSSSASSSSDSSVGSFYDPVEERRNRDIAHTECENNFIGVAFAAIVGLIIIQAYWHLYSV